LSVAEINAHSSNIGAAQMAEALGSVQQLAYFRRFGLLDRHPIRLLEVATPQTPATWRPINTVTASYGHGIAVSPLHVADALARILCGGPMARLTEEEAPAVRSAPLVGAATAAQMRWLMWLTVAEGTGGQAAVPGYLVGGKTGSADKPAGGGYRGGGLLSSFAAAFPIDRPRYVIVVTLDEPEGDAETYGQAHGGWTAAPTTGRIVSRIGPLLGLPPIGPDAERWFRDRLIEGEVFNGRTGRLEPSLKAVPDAVWTEPDEGGTGCACSACSTVG
jgi:cell division protein FtsI (penicillin-binding protein 3)